MCRYLSSRYEIVTVVDTFEADTFEPENTRIKFLRCSEMALLKMDMLKKYRWQEETG